MSTLYVVATPIGNLEDITLRALRVLKEVRLIAAEDTRKTRRLLDRYGIKTPMTSYYEHNKLSRLPEILSQLEAGADIALVSEAGTPGISDPGYELVKGAIERGITVSAAPGVSAVVTALAVSGLPTDRFLFVGFLPARPAARRKALQDIRSERATLVLYEAPHRFLAAVRDTLAVLGDRRIAVCREMTKLHEEVWRGKISQALEHFVTPRGEFTLVIEGAPVEVSEASAESVREALAAMRRAGKSAREAIAAVSAASGLSRKALYRLWLETGGRKLTADS